jgi:hypothetical protein
VHAAVDVAVHAAMQEFAPSRRVRRTGVPLRHSELAMAKLTSKQRDKLPDSKFALPGHKYPVEDAAHARNAKARAAQQVKKGKLSKADEKKVDAKADKVLKKKS